MTTIHESKENIMQNGRIHEDGEERRLRKRVERARDVVEDVRERAELAFREHPYLLPLSAGAVGLGIGILLGSKITRFVVFSAVGALVSDMFGGEIKRIGREFMEDLQRRLATEEEEA